MKRRLLLTGNEAIAAGARAAGIAYASAYPGTPSTEILETIVRLGGPKAEWAPNEKVALESAYGVSLGGGRAICSMKHVGVNVAADPLFSAVYAGVRGGLVLVSADDPAMHSSQNEQDNRHFARAAKLPMLEPSDSQEALDFTMRAFEISERFDVPVLLRVTTRICHSMSPVELDPEAPYDPKSPIPYARDVRKHVLVPAHARARHEVVEARLGDLEAFGVEEGALNRIEWGDRRLGVVTSGVAYAYVREALPDATVLKLGLSHPLPRALVRELAAGVEDVYVVEELDPFLEEQVRALGIRAVGKALFPVTGELSPDRVAEAFGIRDAGERAGPRSGSHEAGPAAPALPPRPPVLCPGCGHRGVFYTLAKMDLVVAGDIGCYSLGALPPLEGMDSCLCMGASVGMMHGLETALRSAGDSRRVVGVIGDSTFVHSGITGLVHAVYNGGRGTLLVLDNRITAMTGRQDHPGTGRTAEGDEAPALDLVALCRALGVERVREVDPYDLGALEATLEEELEADTLSVIVVRAVCRLVDRRPIAPPARVTIDCPGCGACLELGCPGLDFRDGAVTINEDLCPGCGLCVEICPFCGIEIERRELATVGAP